MPNDPPETVADFEATHGSLAAATFATLSILLYLLIVSNVFPKDVLRNQYKSQCATQSYIIGGAFLFQHQSQLEGYLR